MRGKLNAGPRVTIHGQKEEAARPCLVRGRHGKDPELLDRRERLARYGLALPAKPPRGIGYA